MMKLLISSLMLAMLTGCVSPYYYPVPYTVYPPGETTQGAPYQDAYGDESYAENGYYEDSNAGSYSYAQTAAYYPWWSVDYFYLGNHYYRPYYGNSFSLGVSSGYPYYGTSFSIGLSSGYPYYGPYYYPYYYSGWYAPYSYYNPWFGAYYAWGGGYGRYDPYWRHGYGRHGDRYGHSGGHDNGHGSGGHDRGHGSYGNNEHVSYNGGARGGARSGGDYRQGGERGARGREPVAGDRPGRGQTQPVGTNRNVSVAPSRSRSDRSMVVVDRGDAKAGPNRTGPVNRQENRNSVAPQAPARALARSPAVASYQSGQSRVVAPTNNKAGRSRTGIPVQSRGPAPSIRVNPGQAVAHAAPAAPRSAPTQRARREPAPRSDNNAYSSPAPRDSGNDGSGRSQRDSGGRGDGNRGDGVRRKGH